MTLFLGNKVIPISPLKTASILVEFLFKETDCSFSSHTLLLRSYLTY